MCSPRNIASRRSATPHSSASCAEQPQRLVGDPVLGVVEEEAGALGDQPRAALGVLGEEVAEVSLADLAVVLLEGLPGRSLAELRFRAHRPQPNYAGLSAHA